MIESDNDEESKHSYRGFDSNDEMEDNNESEEEEDVIVTTSKHKKGNRHQNK